VEHVGRPSVEFSFVRDLPLSAKAVEFAWREHAGQERPGDHAAFIVHPLEAASLLARSDYGDEVIAAAILHDVLEDTHVQDTDLASEFGPRVAELVSVVSDDPAIPDEEERKDELRRRAREAGGDALAIYGADKISKVRELRLLAATGEGSAPENEAKLRRHRESLEMLENEAPDTRIAALLRFEIEAFEQLPPAPAARRHSE
jgi:(p)ppGpp synthase/HD superfamily hydrolase